VKTGAVTGAWNVLTAWRSSKGSIMGDCLAFNCPKDDHDECDREYARQEDEQKYQEVEL